MGKSTEQVLVWRFNIPNSITMLRITLGIVVYCFLILEGVEKGTLIGILLIVAWITDALDGFLARKLKQTTILGSLFDLTADRLLMTPVLLMSITGGFWERTATLMPINPYPYAVFVIAGDLAILALIFTFIWKQRNHNIVFPSPTMIAKGTYSVQMLTLLLAILGIGSNVLLAVLMYLSIAATILGFYSYLKKGSYIFTC